MSYFSTALARITERSGRRQADIVRDAGLTRSHVSRLFSGEQRSITDTDLTSVLKAFRDAADQAELIAARCQDVRVGPGAEFVEIRVTAPAGTPARSEAPLNVPLVELSHETEKAFAWLRSQCPLNPDLEKHLLGYARLTGMK